LFEQSSNNDDKTNQKKTKTNTRVLVIATTAVQ